MSPSESWLGQIPGHWQVRRLGTLGRLTKGAGGSRDDNRERGLPVVRYGELYTRFDTVIQKPQSFISKETASRYTPLRKGAIVLAASGEDPEVIGKAALSLLKEPAFVGGDTVLFEPDGRYSDPLFLVYVLESRPLMALKAIRSTGFTVVHISAGKLKTLPIPLPPLPEQQAIAQFLARETSRIDGLIAEQRRLLELLVERRRAVADAVLGTHVGVGDRLKWLIRESDERSGERANTLPLMSVSISWGVRRRDRVSGERAKATDLSNYKVCSQGDLVINRMRAFQGALGLAPEYGIVSPDYAVLQTSPEVNSGWLAAAMRTTTFVSEMAQRVKGIGSAELGNARTPRINITDLGEIRLELPDRAKQDEEHAEIMRQFAQLDGLVLETERFIEIAAERRSALITAVVTGQVDMRWLREPTHKMRAEF